MPHPAFSPGAHHPTHASQAHTSSLRADLARSGPQLSLTLSKLRDDELAALDGAMHTRRRHIAVLSEYSHQQRRDARANVVIGLKPSRTATKQETAAQRKEKRLAKARERIRQRRTEINEIETELEELQ